MLNCFYSKLAINLILVLLVYCVIGDEPKDFCDKNYIDAVLWNGFNYRLVSNDIIADYDRSLGRIEKVAKIVAYDKSDYRYQSSFRNLLPDGNQCVSDSSKECLKRMGRIPTVLTVYSKINGTQYIQFSDQPLDDLRYLTENVFHSGVNENTNIAKTIMKNKQTHKPSTYWPQKDLLVFILNANHSIFGKTSATLLTKSYYKSQNYASGWSETNISEKLLYTAAFYWDETDSVYVVAENKSESQRNGYIYQFNHNDLQNPFLSLRIEVMTFFKCNKSQLVDIDSEQRTTDNRYKSQMLFLILAILLAIIFGGTHIALIIIFTRKQEGDPPRYLSRFGQ